MDGDIMITIQATKLYSTLQRFKIVKTPSYITYTFIGTGCDIQVESGDNIIEINGSPMGLIRSSGQQMINVVSGLPLGTHHIKITNSS